MIEIGSQDRLFVLTGAGVSAESGLPTFRGAGGLWRGTRVEDVASPAAWARDPLMVWQFYSMRRQVHAGKEPNPAHFTLARLEDALGERLFLCTQNVDKLHEQAGSRRVHHMHGQLFQSRCDSCPRPAFDDANVYEDEVPRCRCGGRIRPHICWFGETPYQMDLIELQLRRCTVFIAVGTSGVVYPQPPLPPRRVPRRERGRTTWDRRNPPIARCSMSVSKGLPVGCFPSCFLVPSCGQ